MSDGWKAAGLLLLSNVFMTTAWYGHLKLRGSRCGSRCWVAGHRAVRIRAAGAANRIGYGSLTAYQLKLMQETIALTVFVVFAWLVLGEELSPRYLVSFALLFAAVAVAFWK